MTDPSFIYDERDRMDEELEQREPPLDWASYDPMLTEEQAEEVDEAVNRYAPIKDMTTEDLKTELATELASKIEVELRGGVFGNYLINAIKSELAKRDYIDKSRRLDALAERVADLEGRLGFLTARHNRIIEPAATRLNALEKRQKELAEWIGQQGEGFYDAREERDALAARLDALDARVVELEGPLLVFPAVRGEWVRRNGLIPVFDLDEKEEGGK